MKDTKDATEYEPPRIEDHGSLVELTAGGEYGKFADANIYPGESVVHKLMPTSTP